ncbi:MAG: ATP-binding cassette domain-containing protein, partial [Clostridiales bacterium]|nr:ATP-binding cassette domain-containing protein [Clostridiales bacterium]
MIVLEDVTKRYIMGDTEVRALDHANLHIRQGEFVSIIGPSGSGKSTMMNIIGCLDVADEGRYLLDGHPIEQYSENQLAKIRNKKLGFVFQNFNLIGNLTAWENVELPLIYQRIPKKQRTELVERALDMVQLGQRAKHSPNE